MANIVFDFGRAYGKWYDPRNGKHDRYRHAIAELTQNQWKQVAGSTNGTPTQSGYIKVNGTPYAVGEKARRHVLRENPKGAMRFRKDYYGVGLAYALSCAFPTGSRDVNVFASYAPGDWMHANRLIAAAKGNYKVVHFEGEVEYKIKSVEVFDEPFGGWSHHTLTKEGFSKRGNNLDQKTIYILDVGGHTVDGVAIDPGGEIDLTTMNSTRIGVLNIMEKFENELIADNTKIFREQQTRLDPRRIETALQFGVYRAGRHDIDCKNLAVRAKQSLVNDVLDVFREAGGFVNYDAVLMTGGGAALIVDMLQESQPNIEFLLAEPDRDKIQYANVFGGWKLFRMLDNMGLLNG